MVCLPVSSVLQKRVAVLLVGFARLPGAERSAFLDAINVYLYASPQRRTLLSRHWAEVLAANNGDGDSNGAGAAGKALEARGNKDGASRRRR